MEHVLTDHRKRRDFHVSELITGCIVMFLLHENSRHGFNQDRREEQFYDNYLKIFKLRLPHMDTVNDFIEKLPTDELELLKATLICGLIEQKVFHRFKLLGKHFMIAIDGTGTNSYKENDEQQSRLSRTSKNGNVTYYHYVVEAKLVTSSGLSVSIASEMIANEGKRNFNKQDCEQRAFERLAVKIKKYFPRLPICILADGLYPNKTFMKVCSDNDWAFIVVLQDDNLKRLQEDIKDVENKNRHSVEQNIVEAKGTKHIQRIYQWITEPLSHAGFTLYWLSCTETITIKSKNNCQPPKVATTRFVYITNQPIDKDNVNHFANAGRLRWKIENEGFNTQKNGGYNLGHKFSRKSFTAYKNYYQCMQIAHTINQLVIHSEDIAHLINTNAMLTIKHLWKNLMALLKMCVVKEADIATQGRFQIRLAG